MKFLVEKVACLAKLYSIRGGAQARRIGNLASRDVLRSTGGKLSLVREDSLAETLLFPGRGRLESGLPGDGVTFREGESDLLDVEVSEGSSAPVIDEKSFKNFLMVPPLGLRRYFSSELVKMNENKGVLYKEYVPGSLAAHNYPLTLLPKDFSRRIGPDIFVKTFTEDERNFEMRGNRKVKLSLGPALRVHDSYPLLHKVSGRPALLLVFSGDLPNAQYQSARRWVKSPKVDLGRVLNSPCSRLLGWAYNRYVDALAKSVVEENKLMSITRKLDFESVISLHQYRPQLPSVVLVDARGYIRWHAVGLPTLEALTILRSSIHKLTREM